MRPLSHFRPVLRGLVLLGLAAGCSSFEPARARREQTDAFTTNLAALAAAAAPVRAWAWPLWRRPCSAWAAISNWPMRQAAAWWRTSS